MKIKGVMGPFQKNLVLISLIVSKNLYADADYERLYDMVSKWDELVLDEDTVTYLLGFEGSNIEMIHLLYGLINRSDFNPNEQQLSLCLEHKNRGFREIMVSDMSFKVTSEQVFKALKKYAVPGIRKTLASRRDYIPTQEMLEWALENDPNCSAVEFLMRSDCVFQEQTLQVFFDIFMKRDICEDCKQAIARNKSFVPTDEQVEYVVSEKTSQMIDLLFQVRKSEWTAKKDARKLKLLFKDDISASRPIAL